MSTQPLYLGRKSTELCSVLLPLDMRSTNMLPARSAKLRQPMLLLRSMGEWSSARLARAAAATHRPGGRLLELPTENREIELGDVDYLAASVRLTCPVKKTIPVPQLVVLKSFAGATQLVVG